MKAQRSGIGDLLTLHPRAMGDLIRIPASLPETPFGCGGNCAGCGGCGMGTLNTADLMPTIKTAAIGAVAGIAFGLYLSRKKR